MKFKVLKVLTWKKMREKEGGIPKIISILNKDVLFNPVTLPFSMTSSLPFTADFFLILLNIRWPLFYGIMYN